MWGEGFAEVPRGLVLGVWRVFQGEKLKVSADVRGCARWMIGPSCMHECSYEAIALDDVDQPAWLTDTLARIADHKITRLDELMPWSYAQEWA